MSFVGLGWVRPHSTLLLAEIAEYAEFAPHLHFSAWFVPGLVTPVRRAAALSESATVSDDEKDAYDA